MSSSSEWKPVWHAAERVLHVQLGGPHRSLSWALGCGGFQSVEALAWCEVRNDELGLETDATELLRARIAFLHTQLLGMMTSARVQRFGQVRVEAAGVIADAIATVGLGNAVCVGEPPDGPDERYVGTINIACRVSVPLSDAAYCEALSIATEARTRAVLETRVEVRGTRLATGTGTDCIAIVARARALGEPAHEYAGKHTPLGYVVGAACYRAVKASIQKGLSTETSGEPHV